MNNNQQPGCPQRPDNQPQQPEDGSPYPPIPLAPGQAPAQSWPPPQFQPEFPPYAQQQGQQPFGAPGQQYAQAPAFPQAPPKTGMPVWGWVAGGVGVMAFIAVAGVMAFNGLAGGSKEPDAVPSPNVSASAAPEEKATAAPMAGTGDAVYLFDDSGFSSAPVWSIKEPAGWSKETVKEGMTSYRNATLQCTFTTYQAVLGATGATGGTGDEATTGLVMASEIDAVMQSVGKPVEVVDDSASTYVSLLDGNKDIELQEAQLRFRNDKDVDVTYRMAVRTTAGGKGLMELALACPGSMATAAESSLWLDLTDRVSMVDAP